MSARSTFICTVAKNGDGTLSSQAAIVGDSYDALDAVRSARSLLSGFVNKPCCKDCARRVAAARDLLDAGMGHKIGLVLTPATGQSGLQ